jgi:hypothetical protein
MANKVIKDMLSLTTETRYYVVRTLIHTYTVLTVQNKGMPARYCVALCRKLANRDSTVPAGLKNPKHI